MNLCPGEDAIALRDEEWGMGPVSFLGYYVNDSSSSDTMYMNIVNYKVYIKLLNTNLYNASAYLRNEAFCIYPYSLEPRIISENVHAQLT